MKTHDPEALATTFTQLGMTFQSSKVDNQPRLLGTSKDQATALEIIGTAGNLRRVTVMGEMTAYKLDSAAYTARSMVAVLTLLLPTWKAAAPWLRENLKRLRAVKKVSMRRVDEVLTLSLEPKTGIVVLRIEALP